MSLPARRLDTPPPVAPPTRRRPARPTPSTRAPRGRPGKRRRSLGFLLLSSAVVGSLVFGIVVLNVLLAQASFRIDETERRIEALSREHLDLVREQATLSAPGRISAWASRRGMRLPDDIRILHSPGTGPADPAGADDDQAPGAAGASASEDPP